MILLAGTPQLTKHLKEFDLIVLLYSDTSVSYRELYFICLLLERSLHSYHALTSKLECIRDKINDDLIYPPSVGDDHVRYIMTIIDIKLYALRLHLQMKHVVYLLEQFVYHYLFLHLLKPVILNLIHV